MAPARHCPTSRPVWSTLATSSALSKHQTLVRRASRLATTSASSSSSSSSSYTAQSKNETLLQRASFYQRKMPNSLVPFQSKKGRPLFLHALQNKTAEAYFPLAQQFITQDEPAFCGPACLAMVLNALRIDPNTTWKGGWRWFDERNLVASCCKPMDQIKVEGITLDEFASLGRCHGAAVTVFRPLLEKESKSAKVMGSEQHFRKRLIDACSSPDPPFMIVSFLRTSLGQTGTGHFSPVAAYHEGTDSALILDIARFKLPPYWVPISAMYKAMQPLDSVTGRPRGYALLGGAPQVAGAQRSMAQLGGGGGRCPITPIKQEYCPVSPQRRSESLQEMWHHQQQQ